MPVGELDAMIERLVVCDGELLLSVVLDRSQRESVIGRRVKLKLLELGIRDDADDQAVLPTRYSAVRIRAAADV
jgi:hypothetical protein